MNELYEKRIGIGRDETSRLSVIAALGDQLAELYLESNATPKRSTGCRLAIVYMPPAYEPPNAALDATDLIGPSLIENGVHLGMRARSEVGDLRVRGWIAAKLPLRLLGNLIRELC